MGRRKRGASGPPATTQQMARRAAPLGIADEVNLSFADEQAKSSSTLKTYERFITGKDGWLQWTAAQALPPLSLSADAPGNISRYYIFRTQSLKLGEDLGGQLAVSSANGLPAYTAGNPANSSKVKSTKTDHHKARVRTGDATPESVDVIEPVHIRAFHARNLRGRRLHDCDPLSIMLHAGVQMAMTMLLRFNELTDMETCHLGQSEEGGSLHPCFSLASTKNSFQRKGYHLVPWPTSLSLDPR
ncbi:hypothetical protein BU14_0052s0009 [Porphyra umbilicalis]|uniref:Uncharacterized protein n=1 Tax=Porphyra umbilicalis TaxID=2786 RepID=A0A1X6PI91_PORUM|nr:hypothetical protein BU14_0052s0009 [Porphyra umbilicalis]|eukprot:OSX80393.1 hypothetical protein BU14_0052s0009 [Porphyra umbilicalis]